MTDLRTSWGRSLSGGGGGQSEEPDDGPVEPDPVVIETRPTMDNTKDEILAWLAENDVTVGGSTKKAKAGKSRLSKEELLELVDDVLDIP